MGPSLGVDGPSSSENGREARSLSTGDDSYKRDRSLLDLPAGRHRGVNKVGGSTEHTTTVDLVQPANQHGKWVMLDPTSNLYRERRGVPLNAWEIRQEWFHNYGKELVPGFSKEGLEITPLLGYTN